MKPGDTYRALTELLRSRSGLSLGPGKLYLLETRLAPILKREGLADLAALVEGLCPGDGLEADIVEAMTTNESLFFRDGRPFAVLREQILPRLHRSRPAGVPLRIWSAGAASGQEAYSIAMVVAEMGCELEGRPVEIVGTDIARAPLTQARTGLYSRFEIQRGLPMRLLAKYFVNDGTQWRAIPQLRNAVSFRICNLLADAGPLGRFDIVFCRNVLIYFDLHTKRQVLAGIAAQIAQDGALFLGGAETVLGMSDQFNPSVGEAGTYTPVAGLRQVA